LRAHVVDVQQVDVEALEWAYGLCQASQADVRQLHALRRATPEYGQSEFLLPVDVQGQPTHCTTETLARYRQSVATCPEFAHWFQEARLPGDDAPVLLAARWLCHLLGLRHATVQLFLDHPTLPDVAWVQLRGFHKAEAPATFDLPMAGHVSGVETPAQALGKELQEELGLTLDDLSELRMVSGYAAEVLRHDNLLNLEYHWVYRARLHPESLTKLRPVAPEVAAICAFPFSELRQLVRCHARQVAPGLLQYMEEFGIVHYDVTS